MTLFGCPDTSASRTWRSRGLSVPIKTAAAAISSVRSFRTPFSKAELDSQDQGVIAVGLLNEICSACFHRPDRALHVTLTRHYNDRKTHVHQMKLLLDLQAIHLRHS